jgi:protein-disulfide isomerase
MILIVLVVHYAGPLVVLGQDAGTKQVPPVESQTFSIPEERSAGRKEAPVVIEVFSDFQCAGCAEFYLQTLTRVIEEYCESDRVYLIHREYPLPIHRYALEAARWALACAGIGKYEQAAAALFRNQSIWGKDGNIEAAIASVLTPAELAGVIRAMKDDGDRIAAALESDVSLGHSFPVHGTPSFRILVHGAETFADHDEPEKILPTDPRLKEYPILKRYLDEYLAK